MAISVSVQLISKQSLEKLWTVLTTVEVHCLVTMLLCYDPLETIQHLLDDCICMGSYCKSRNILTETLVFDLPLNKRKIPKFEEFILNVVLFNKKPQDHHIAATIATGQGAKRGRRMMRRMPIGQPKKTGW